jgi:hypothetical protein
MTGKYFPLWPDDQPWYGLLLQAARNVRKVIDGLLGHVESGSVEVEEALVDGAYLTRLVLAEQLIEESLAEIEVSEDEQE